MKEVLTNDHNCFSPSFLKPVFLHSLCTFLYFMQFDINIFIKDGLDVIVNANSWY
jgi:hypothetical protein